jgi:hypothetical protein
MNTPDDPLRGCPLYDRSSTKKRHLSAHIERPFRAMSRRERMQQTNARLCGYPGRARTPETNFGGRTEI